MRSLKRLWIGPRNVINTKILAVLLKKQYAVLEAYECSNHILGTSFRSQANLENKINGSCNHVSTDGAKQLKLKLKFCSENEIESGACIPCQSQTCLFDEGKISSTACCKHTMYNFICY